MSKRHPLWAIERPDGTIIQESVTQRDKTDAWYNAEELDNDVYGELVTSLKKGDSSQSHLKKLGYKLVKVKAVKCD